MLDQTLFAFNSVANPLDSGNFINSDNSVGFDDQSPTNTALGIMGIDETLLAKWENLEANSGGWANEILAPSATSLFKTGLRSSTSASSSSAIDTLTGGQFGTNSANDGLLAAQASNRARHLEGSLKADRFSVNLNEKLTVVSGNGNVEYGRGRYDYLDLSNISVSFATRLSTAENGGVLFNTGKGDRIFDSLWFNNGSQILFEGLDGIRFSDRWIDLSVDPNDPQFDEQWNLHMMGVQNAWRFTKGSSKVLVGVQDSGLGYNASSQSFHPDLGSPIYYRDNVADEFFREVQDDYFGRRNSSHGTGVHSIIGAKSNNGRGMSGINWNSRVFNIDVLDGNSGDLSLAAATQRMINHANSQGQRLVVNMSLGGGGSIEPAFRSLVANNQNNALFVIASGNENKNSLSNPATLGQQYGNVIAVGASWGTKDTNGRATNPGDRISYPGGWGSNYGHGLSLMGPSEVVAASAAPSQRGTQFGYESKFNGTSAAAPNVAGVASLVWSVNPQLTARQVHQILAETAYDLGSAGYDYVTGSGFVNADAAVRRAMAIARSSSASALASSSVAAASLLGDQPEALGQTAASAEAFAEPLLDTLWASGSLQIADGVQPRSLFAPMQAMALTQAADDRLESPADAMAIAPASGIEAALTQRPQAQRSAEPSQGLETLLSPLSLAELLELSFGAVA